MANQLSSSGKYLHDRLRSLKQSSKRRQTGKIINVGGVGGVVSAAYEQLRNAARVYPGASASTTCNAEVL